MKNKNVKEGGAYLFYSVLTTLVNWLVYGAFVSVFKRIGIADENSIIFISNTLSWFFAVLFSFVVNKLRVFKSENSLLPELVKFFSTRIAVGLVEIVLVPVLAIIGLNRPLFGAEGMLSKIIVTPILILLNYLCGKFLVFRQKSKKE